MSAEVLLRDPGFQLNLLLWMAKEQPANGHVVRPLLHELGFTLVYIENPFPLPEETATAAGAANLDISVTPEPDVLVRRERDMKALYFETKASSFSPDSSTAKQARGHLLAAGPAFAEVMAPGLQCLLCYVVPECDRVGMDSCLTSLAIELRERALKPGPHSVHGLALQGTNVHYTWNAQFKAHADVQEDSAVVLRDVTDDTDPSPLYLVFSAEDYPNPERQDLCRKALQNQVHAVLLCELYLCPPGTEYVRTVEDLLLKTTDGVFQYIGRERQRAMRQLIRENLFKRIFEFWRDKRETFVRLEESTLEVHCRDASQSEMFLDWLEDWKRTGFDTTAPPPEEPLPLLRMMERATTTKQSLP